MITIDDRIIPLNPVLLKGCQIVGVFWGSFAMREPERNRAHCERLLAWIGDIQAKGIKTVSMLGCLKQLRPAESSESISGAVTLAV